MGEISQDSERLFLWEYYFTTAVKLRLALLTLGPSAYGRLMMPAT